MPLKTSWARRHVDELKAKLPPWKRQRPLPSPHLVKVAFACQTPPLRLHVDDNAPLHYSIPSRHTSLPALSIFSASTRPLLKHESFRSTQSYHVTASSPTNKARSLVTCARSWIKRGPYIRARSQIKRGSYIRARRVTFARTRLKRRNLHFESRQNPERAERNGTDLLNNEDQIPPQVEPDEEAAHVGTYSSISNRRRKRLRSPPSRALARALRGILPDSTHPTKWTNKVDHSFQSPLSSTATRKPIFKRPSLCDDIQELSLQWVLASYTTKAANPVDGDDYYENLSTIFNADVVNYLDSKSYQETDIVLWHWILSTAASERAALRLNLAWIITTKRTAPEKPPVPVFVFLNLLQRNRLDLHAVFHLVSHAWQRLGGITPTFSPLFSGDSLAAIQLRVERLQRGDGEDTGEGEATGDGPRDLRDSTRDNIYKMTEPSIMLMAVRLFRHVRKVWPASLQSIAVLFTRFINGQTLDSKTLDKRVTSRLSKLYNRALSLIALPSSKSPFAHISHHQQAQFIVLRAMDTHIPPLVVNREGYRGVARVQLAHRKTLSEQSWADLKVSSWPPWKEDKLGFDAEKGIESGLSRAGHALQKMQDAGYSMHVWEQTAQIYAGWDTDSSPTIQTRKFIPKTFPMSKAASRVDSATPPGKKQTLQESVWAARVRATRTLDEAWVCFLNYRRAHRERDKREQQVYLAMFEKLFHDEKRSKDEQQGRLEETNSSVFPGDGLEVFPKPTYSNISIYVPTPPPSLNNFLKLMHDHGVRPVRRLLAFLLSHAYSFDFGRKSYSYSYRPSPVLLSFLYRRDNEIVPEVAEVVKTWPSYLQAAFLRFVGKFMTPKRPRLSRAQAPFGAHRDTLFHDDRDLGLALLLMVKPHYLPAWYAVISTLAAGLHTDYHGVSEVHLLDSRRILKIARGMQEIDLEPDMEGIQLMCVALEASLWAQSSVSAQAHPRLGQARLSREEYSDESYVARIKDEAEKASGDLLEYIKRAFQRCISIAITEPIFQDSPTPASSLMLHNYGTVDPQTRLPRVFDMPPAAVLHALVRVLGLSRDYTGIVQLAQWIARHGPEIHLANHERGRGNAMLKKVTVAIRVFLDRAWVDEVGRTRSCTTTDGNEHHDLEESTAECEEPFDWHGTEEVYKTDELGVDSEVSSGQNAKPEETDRGVEDLIQGAVDAIDAIHYDWGGRPTDGEAEEYLRRGRNF